MLRAKCATCWRKLSRKSEVNLRASVLLTTAVLGLALHGVWLFARAALIEVQRLLDRDTIKAFVERASGDR